jgi:hypothetical protein
VSAEKELFFGQDIFISSSIGSRYDATVYSGSQMEMERRIVAFHLAHLTEIDAK